MLTKFNSFIYSILYFSLFIGLQFVLSSCGKDDEKDSPDPNLLKKEFNIKLNTQQNTLIPVGRTETAIASLKIYGDNQLEFSIKVTGLQNGDVLTKAEIFEGNLFSNIFNTKTIVDGTTIKFQTDSVKSKIQMAVFEVDSLIKSPHKFNITVYSQKAPNGLLRGFFDKELAFGADIPLSSRNINPPISRNDSAFVRLRITQDNKLHSQIEVIRTTIEDDVLKTTKIHEGNRFTNNGAAIITIASQITDYEVVKTISISSSDVEKLKTQTLYINTISEFLSTPGLMRGQIR